MMNDNTKEKKSKTYVLGGLELNKDQIAEIAKTRETTGFEIIDTIMAKVMSDAIEDIVGNAKPKAIEDYVIAHGEVRAVKRWIEWQDELEKILDDTGQHNDENE